jgi:hypothetical protein
MSIFFQAVTREWPHWLHYLSKERNAEQIALALALLMPVTPVARGGGMRGFSIDPDAFAATMHRLFDAMNTLHEQHGWTADENMAMTDRILAALENAPRSAF